jgi:hypothetical protein
MRLQPVKKEIMYSGYTIKYFIDADIYEQKE